MPEARAETEGKGGDAIPNTSAIPGPTKAAVMMVTLGPEACAQIFKSLDDEDVEILTAEIARLEGITPDTYIRDEIYVYSVRGAESASAASS